MGQAAVFPCYSESVMSRSEMVSNRIEIRSEGLEQYDPSTMNPTRAVSPPTSGQNTPATVGPNVSSPHLQVNHTTLDGASTPNGSSSSTPHIQYISPMNSMPNLAHSTSFPSMLYHTTSTPNMPQQPLNPVAINTNKAHELLSTAWDEDALTSDEKDAATCFKQTKRLYTGNELVTPAELQNLICYDRFCLNTFLPFNTLMNETATTSSITIGLAFLKDNNTLEEERRGLIPLGIQVGTAILFWSAARHLVIDIRGDTDRRKIKLVAIARLEGTKRVSHALTTVSKLCCRFNGKQYYDENACNAQHFVYHVLTKLNLDNTTSMQQQQSRKSHFHNGYLEELKRGQYKAVYFYSKAIKDIVKSATDLTKDHPNWRQECADTLSLPLADVDYFVDNDMVEFDSRARLDKFGIVISQL